MFGWEFPPHNSGGLGVACHGLATALAGRDIDIAFVLPKRADMDWGPGRFIFADVPHVKLKEVDSLLRAYSTTASYAGSRYLHRPEMYGATLFDEVCRYAVLAQSIAENEDFDIIHAHDWLSFGAGLEAKKVSGKPLIVHVHATEFDRTGGNGLNQNIYEVEKEGMEKADAVIAVSNFTRDMITRHYGIDPDKIHVVYNAINIWDYKNLAPEFEKLKKAGTKVVLFVGRITLQKGPDYFLKAAKKVLEYRPDTIFVIAGSGDMEHQIIDEAARLGIAEKVFFVGFLRGEELHKTYQGADLYVLPSVSEPFGIAPLEALANGTPVLVSKQSGISEVLSHALKVDFWDIDEMANQIVAALEHEPLTQCLIECEKEELPKFNWQDSASKCIGVYKELLSV